MFGPFVWESLEAYGAVFQDPEFRRQLDAYPDSAMAMPHIFQTAVLARAALDA